jgi:hypothetical protein
MGVVEDNSRKITIWKGKSEFGGREIIRVGCLRRSRSTALFQ